MGSFTRKGYGRIYVEDQKYIERIREIIKEMDAFEYDYLPSDLIVPFSEYPNIVYTHKFDTLDCTNLAVRCWMEGIFILCVDNGCNDYIRDPVQIAQNKENENG